MAMHEFNESVFVRQIFTVLSFVEHDMETDCYSFDFNKELSGRQRLAVLRLLFEKGWIDNFNYDANSTDAYKIADTLAYASENLDVSEYCIPSNIRFYHNEDGILYAYSQDEEVEILPNLDCAEQITLREIASYFD